MVTSPFDGQSVFRIPRSGPRAACLYLTDVARLFSPCDDFINGVLSPTPPDEHPVELLVERRDFVYGFRAFDDKGRSASPLSGRSSPKRGTLLPSLAGRMRR